MTDHNREQTDSFFSSRIMNRDLAAQHFAGAGKMIELGFGGAS